MKADRKMFSIRSRVFDSEEWEDEVCLRHVEITVSTKGENAELAAHVLGHVISSEDCFLGGECIFDVLDSISGDCVVIGAAIQDFETDEIKPEFLPYNEFLKEYSEVDTVFVLDTIKVEPKFRNQGIGSLALSMIDSILFNQNIYPCVIYGLASPFEYFQKQGYNNQREKLVRFYEKNGYTVHNIDNNYIICRFPFE